MYIHSSPEDYEIISFPNVHTLSVASFVEESYFTMPS